MLRPRLSRSGNLINSHRAPIVEFAASTRLPAMANHLGKANKIGHRQAPLFSARLECSRVENFGWLRHQRVELETDLIGGHVLSIGHAPIAQFLG